MNLENQVCSLELAKKLKELGVKQESLFYHTQAYYLNAWKVTQTKFSDCHRDGISAFTASELWEILPKLSHDKNSHILSAFKMINQRVGYGPLYSSGETLVEAIAKLLIKLLENKLITL